MISGLFKSLMNTCLFSHALTGCSLIQMKEIQINHMDVLERARSCAILERTVRLKSVSIFLKMPHTPIMCFSEGKPV